MLGLLLSFSTFSAIDIDHLQIESSRNLQDKMTDLL